MLNAADYAAIDTAIWAHPHGVAYLAKMAQVEALSISCGNPCCNRRVGGDDAWHKARRKYQKRKKVFEDALEATIRQAYAKLRGDVPEAVVVAVKPFVETSHDTTTPPVYAVDWAAFVKDFERATIIWDMQISLRNESLLAAVERRIDEEEALLLLM